jgi:hypothetical protein
VTKQKSPKIDFTFWGLFEDFLVDFFLYGPGVCVFDSFSFFYQKWRRNRYSKRVGIIAEGNDEAFH